MKEITRIHIAKVSYEAELEAKRELESYLKTLEAYSEEGIVEDVEIRMTEILAERGVKSGGVVTVKDVKALEEQLGKPRDFMGEGDMAVGPEDEQEISPDASRKLFRDVDHAVLGGVLSGIAAFFKISPALVRVLFIIIALASFGTALLVYIVLWVAVPPAKTAADKLQMNGLPVTLSSIRQLNESEEGAHGSDSGIQGKKVLLSLLGVFSVMGAVGAAALTLFVVMIAALGQSSDSIQMDDGAGFLIAAFVLAVISGLLLSALFSLGAYASFAMRATKRVVVSMGVIVVVGLLSFGMALGLAQYGTLRYGDAIKANTHEEQLTLPENMAKVDRLVVQTSDVRVRYIVSKETPKATSRVVAEQKQKAQDVTLTVDGSTLKIAGAKQKTTPCQAFWCENPYVTIYGPALQSVEGQAGAGIEYVGENQSLLSITALEKADIVLSKGTYESVVFTGKSKSSIEASAANVSRADVRVEGSATISLGTVAELAVHVPHSCAAGAEASVGLTGISKNFILNDQVTPIRNISEACINITIESER